MEFRILGRLEALEDGLAVSLGGPKQRSVLAMLLLDPNRSVSTDRLVDGLWGDDPPLRPAATLQVYVSHLRKALEPDRRPRAEPSVLLTQPPGYLLAVDPEQIDLFRFERMLGVARALWSDGCVPGSAVLFREALALWREAPLADLAGEPFASFEVPRLEETRTGAIEDRIDADLALGRDVELLPDLEALVARNPYRERLRRQLMVALYRSGRQADALSAYQAARRALVDELGLEPSRELREMEAAILVQDPTLAPVELAAMAADDVARVFRAANGAEPDGVVVESVVEAGRHSARRAEEALRQAIDHEQTSRLSATLEAASATQVELVRARRVIADRVLDRRNRHAPRPAVSDRGARNGSGNAAVGSCPYKGLLRFEPEDAGWYFGRERLVAELLASVASTRCTGVVGASGSGKSSLTRAGLLAALRDDALPGSAEWPRLLVTPGADPMLELARALTPACHAASPDQVRDRLLEDPESLSAFAARATSGMGRDASVVIVVDQLEEVFTVCHDDSVRERFLDVLVHGASDPDSPTRILAAIRADYYGRCAEHAAFAELLGNASVLVGPMRPDELQRAIEEPARSAGLLLEDGLVDRIFDDVGTEPGSLPLLETALLETWIRRDRQTLTLEGYEASGGVRGAVAHLADEVYARMSSSDQDIARGIFLRLAEPGVGTDDVRRRAPLEELIVVDDHGAVLATLVEHRLVVTGDVTAEVAHEALLRAWPRLRSWLEEDREGRRVHRALSNAAQEWAAGERDDDLLFRGSRLAAALDVADAHPAEINPVEREFLGAGAEREQREEDDLRALAHAQARSNRRLRRSLTAVAVLLVCALIAGAVAISGFARAADERDRAEASSRRTAVQNLVSQSLGLRDTRRDLAALLAVAGYRLAPGSDTESALFATFTGAPGFAGHLRGGEHFLYRSGAFLPGGHRLAVVDAAGELRIFDADRLAETEHVTVSSARALDAVIAVSHDGSTLAVASDTGVADAPGELRVLDSATLRASFDAVRLDFPVRSLAVSPDGRLAAVSGGDDARVEIRDARTGALVVSAYPQRSAANTSSQGSTAGLAFSAPDRLVVASQAGSVQTLDAHTGETLATIAGPPGLAGPSGCCPLRSGWVVRLTADGRSAVTSGPAGTMRWDLANGRAAWPEPASQSCRSFTIAEASSAVICGVGFARTVALDLETGVTRAERYGGNQSSVDDLAISDDGRVLAVIGGFDAQGPLQTDIRATAAIWRLDGAGPIHRTLGSGRLVPLGNDGYDPAGRLLLLTAPQGAAAPLGTGGLDLKVMDPNTGAIVDELDGILGAAWSGQRDKLAALFTDGTNGLYDVARHTRLPGKNKFDILPIGVLPDPAHGRLIVWDNAGHVRAVSMKDGSPTSPSFDIPATNPATWAIGWRLVVSPDGRTLVGASVEYGLQSFDVATGRRVAGPRREYFRVVMSPNGEAVAWTAANRVAIFDPVTLEPLSDALPASFGPIFNLLFSADGQRMVVYSPAGTYQLVDWPSRTPLGDPIAWGNGVPAPWSFVDLRDDGQQLAFPGAEGITVWDLDRDTWIDRACALAGRDLTPAEWQHYLGAFGEQREICT